MATARRPSRESFLSRKDVPANPEEMYEMIAATDPTDSARDAKQRHLDFLEAPPKPRPDGCVAMERVHAIATEVAETTEDEALHFANCLSCADARTMLYHLHLEAQERRPQRRRHQIDESVRQGFVASITRPIVNAAVAAAAAARGLVSHDD